MKKEEEIVTGRFYVHSNILNRTFCVEPTGDPHTKWGDIDVATRTLQTEGYGKIGTKSNGSVVDTKDSIITEANGYTDIVMLGVGESPVSYIEKLEQEFLAKQK